MVACHTDKGPAAWAFAFFCMCPVTYRKMFGPALNGERSEEEASPAASSLAWSTKTSKRDDGSVALIGVPLNVDGTRGEAPQDAEEWISDAFCLCAAAWSGFSASGLGSYKYKCASIIELHGSNQAAELRRRKNPSVINKSAVRARCAPEPRKAASRRCKPTAVKPWQP